MFPKQREVYVPLLREMIRRGGATKPSARNAEGKIKKGKLTLYSTAYRVDIADEDEL